MLTNLSFLSLDNMQLKLIRHHFIIPSKFKKNICSSLNNLPGEQLQANNEDQTKAIVKHSTKFR